MKRIMALAMGAQIAFFGFGFQKSSIEIQKLIEGYAADFLNRSVAHSVSIGIYQKGSVFTHHQGPLDPIIGTQPTNDTIYEIASVSKTFVGILAAKAVLDGKLALDADIRTYLNDAYPNLEVDGEPVRVRHLVTHTSGFPEDHLDLFSTVAKVAENQAWQAQFIAEKNYSKQKFFKDLKQLRLKTKPGLVFRYSNLSTNMTAYLIERVYGKPFEQLVKTLILDKANMNQTHMNLKPQDMARLANGYNDEGTLMPPLPLGYTLWGGEGALKSTVPDMIEYMRFVLDARRPEIKEAQRRLFKLDDGYWMGYFWWVINLRNGVNHKDGVKTIRHDGGAIGTRNVFRVYPNHQVGIWVVSNMSSPAVTEALTKLSYDLFEAVSPTPSGLK